MNGYIAYYGNYRAEVHAENTLRARTLAVAIFQKQHPRRRIKPFEVSVILAEKNGEQVTHSTASL